MGIALGHLADEFLVSLLLCIELLQCLLVLLPGDFVLLLEVLDLVLALLELPLQRAAYLALAGQLVVGLLFGGFQHENQRIGREHILLGKHLGVG